MARAMVGTVRGATPCGRCRHARQRHTERGRGPCATSTTRAEPQHPGRDIVVRLIRCDCPGFQDRKD